MKKKKTLFVPKKKVNPLALDASVEFMRHFVHQRL